MEQHQRWAGARERLWVGKLPPQVQIVSVEPVEVERPEAPWGAPIDLLFLPSARTIIRLVSLRSGISVDDILGPRRNTAIVKARQQAMVLVYTHCQSLSLLAIGRVFNKDHTTVLHTLKKCGVYVAPAEPLFVRKVKRDGEAAND